MQLLHSHRLRRKSALQISCTFSPLPEATVFSKSQTGCYRLMKVTFNTLPGLSECLAIGYLTVLTVLKYFRPYSVMMSQRSAAQCPVLH